MDSTANITVGLAFVAGLLSFISPCVLPLMPAYVSYMSARAAQSTGGNPLINPVSLAGSSGGAVSTAITTNRAGLLMHGLMFVLGFTLVFVGFGIAINASIQLLGISFYSLQNTLARVGGLIVIFFGLHIMGVTGWVLRQIRAHFGKSAGGVAEALDGVQSVLFADTRRQMNPRNSYGYLGSIFMGLVFAAGWTPCVGPVYGSILFLASNGSTNTATVMLTAYSLGLAIPFLITAMALDQVRPLFKRLQRNMRLIEVVSGVFLIGMGYLLFTNHMSDIAARLTGLSDFSYNVEECGTGLARGSVAFGDLGQCLQVGPNYKYVTPVPSVSLRFDPVALTFMERDLG